MRKWRVVLDPSQGGRETGLAADDVMEKDVNLAVCLLLRDILQTADIEVVLTRDADEEVTDYQRIETANGAGADLYVAWHCDALEDTTVAGVSLWVDKQLGDARSMSDVERIGYRLCETSGQLMMGVFQEQDKVMSLIELPAVQIRGAFLSHPEERALCTQPTFLRKQATGAARGIVECLQRLKERF